MLVGCVCEFRMLCSKYNVFGLFRPCDYAFAQCMHTFPTEGDLTWQRALWTLLYVVHYYSIAFPPAESKHSVTDVLALVELPPQGVLSVLLMFALLHSNR